MSPEHWTNRIRHILEAIAEVQGFTAGMSFEQFAADIRTARAVAYDFVIIGEAARNVPAEVQQRYPHIPWALMQGMRNIIAHEYFRVDLPVLWDTITHNLPPLVPLLSEMLERES